MIYELRLTKVADSGFKFIVVVQVQAVGLLCSGHGSASVISRDKASCKQL